ncbi:cilia-and flagella-associated protein 96 [Engraulis encrasicolus]|uniref:cilia-and flagella-associated protein 96 n=1 Tax=Engraulis encrasicolus TaxID=184585 RepID=UPI002FD5B54C
MAPEGKSDMDRVGLFQEMGYISVGDKYIPYTYRVFNDSAHKSKQMQTSGPKKKSGLQAGYFDAHFKRIFEREALNDPVKLARQCRNQQSKKNIGKAFLPSNGEKRPSGVGSYYGTIAGPVEAMSAQYHPRKPYKSPGKNLYTSPAKKGSGYGFPNVTLSKLELYAPDPYERARDLLKREITDHKTKLKGGPFRLNLHPKVFFDGNPYKVEKPVPQSKKTEDRKHRFAVPFKPTSPSKSMGGMKAGTFDNYPSHSADPYVLRKPKPIVTNKDGKIFRPTPGPKSTPIKSIITVNVNRKMNATNFNTMPPLMVY